MGNQAPATVAEATVLDLLARDLGLDPFAIRLRNVTSPTSPPARMITGRPLAGVTAGTAPGS